jgi:hypothetical protein
MGRKIELEIVEAGVTAIAELYEKEAPNTCEALWGALEKPIENQALHTIWMGRTIELGVPEDHQVFDPQNIPLENGTIYPLPGDLVWKHFSARAIRGLESPRWDIMVVYGPEAIMQTPAGTAPCCVWAHITDNLQPFCEECARMWFGGARTFRIFRLEE